ncbi:G3E family GTPase [Nitrospirillum amazonense]|uniref:G3E family GTPase n=1 Tax=Nitrospirillum amazonense TaxID=28077 RepID=A0A560ERC7_9PROT|nr:GTP-binding protein [Nitrospirillum amazonense]TWB11930.1 G3E family GTPase [Nitrospirillum amazonense]
MTAVSAARLPISVLTGFLGSGKTTLLSRIIRDPRMARTAVIINEFGEVGLDHLLVAKADENTVLMDSGCICCTIRSDLADTLRDLYLRRLRDEVPEFDRVVIETTGLADPAPILHTLMTDPLVAARFRLDGVVTTVDAVHGMGQLDAQEESLKQAAVADRLVLTKTDIATPEAVEYLKERLKQLNPAASVVDAQTDEALPVLLFDAGLYNPETKSLDVQRWLRAEAYDDHGHHHDHHHHDHDHDGHDHDGHDHADCDHDPGHCAHEDHDHDPSRHDQAIGAFCLTFTQPLVWDELVGFLETLARLRGPDVLRVKGVLNVVESDQPIVIHGVQHLFHPPVQLDAWPSDDHRSRIVFITRDVSRQVVETLYASCTGKSVG